MIKKYGLEWKNVVGVCTDGAPNMQGRKVGLVSFIAKVAVKKCSFTHCVIHREALAGKKLSVELNETLEEVIQFVNSIKSKPLQSSFFEIICEELGSEHTQLLYHNDARWFSRGKMLSRVYEQLHELEVFCIENKTTHTKYRTLLNDDQWKIKVAYLADIFGALNDLNQQIQGKGMHVFAAMNKIDAFTKKIVLWSQNAAANHFLMLPLVAEIISNDNRFEEYI